MLWRIYQLLVAFAAGSVLIYIGVETGEPPNPYILGIVSGGAAYGATVGLSWLLARRRRRLLSD